MNVVGNKRQADKNIKSRNSKLLIDDIQITNRWIEYLEELYDGEKLEDLEIKDNDDHFKIRIRCSIA